MVSQKPKYCKSFEKNSHWRKLSMIMVWKRYCYASPKPEFVFIFFLYIFIHISANTSLFGLKFSQMILHIETSKLMYNWSFLLVVLHKPTLLPSTFNLNCTGERGAQDLVCEHLVVAKVNVVFAGHSNITMVLGVPSDKGVSYLFLSLKYFIFLCKFKDIKPKTQNTFLLKREGNWQFILTNRNLTCNLPNMKRKMSISTCTQCLVYM